MVDRDELADDKQQQPPLDPPLPADRMVLRGFRLELDMHDADSGQQQLRVVDVGGTLRSNGTFKKKKEKSKARENAVIL